jgi:GNAT superfamily N-acetyltransferase
MRNVAAAHPEGVPQSRFIVTLDITDLALVHVEQAYWMDKPGLFDISISHIPGCDRLDEILEIAEAEARRLGSSEVFTWTRTDYPEFQEAARRRGYVEGQVNPVAVLKLESFEPGQWSIREQTAMDAGYGIVDVQSYAAIHPETWLKVLWRMEMDLLGNVPMPEPWVDIPFPDWKKEFLANPLKLDWFFFAMLEDQVVGMTQLFPSFVDSRIMNTGLTGVHQDHRRRGVATMLKCHALRLAKASGAERVYTDNEEKNPMLSLNHALGFREAYRSIYCSRVLANDRMEHF